MHPLAFLAKICFVGWLSPKDMPTPQNQQRTKSVIYVWIYYSWWSCPTLKKVPWNSWNLHGHVPRSLFSFNPFTDMHVQKSILSLCNFDSLCYRIAGNFCWYKILQKCVHADSLEEDFAVFIFTEWMHDALTTPVDGHAPHANRINHTEWWSKEASSCNNSLVFLLCGGLCNFEKYQALSEKLACWTKGFSTADLDFDNFQASLIGLLPFCIVAGWFFSTATI